MGDFDFMGGGGSLDDVDVGDFADGLGGMSGDDGFGDFGEGFGDLGGGLDDLDFGTSKSKKKDRKGSKKGGRGKGGVSDDEEDLDDLFGYTPKVGVVRFSLLSLRWWLHPRICV